jgi:hypothetical protein
MSGQGTMSKKHPGAGTTLGSWDLWTLGLAALACACALVVALTRITGEHDAIQGSGNRIAEDRPVGRFERVSLGDLGTLIVSQGDEEALTVETDDNLLCYVESQVRSGTLILGLSDRAKGRGVKPSKGIIYHLSVQHLAGLEVADSGRIQARVLDAGHLEITAQDSGGVEVASLAAKTLKSWVEDSGYIHLAGRVESQEVTVQDSGRYLAGRLQSRTAAVTAGDSAEATVWAMEVLDATATDSGRVCYYGEPRSTQHLSDNGKLTGLGEP